MLQHDVYFYLKPGTTESDYNKFEAGIKSLLNIDTLIRGHYGKPADTADRPVVDKSYDFVLYTTFESVADHDAYQQHPVHQKFLTDHKHLWQEVKVYDSELFS